jgi:ribonuclease J
VIELTNILFFGGVNEIGGNKILIKDKKNDASVFLDFGMNFEKRRKYFEEFITPRVANGLIDLLELGLLPNIKGIYREDLLKHGKMEIHKEPIVDAILLSHAHYDHSAYISFLDERIPIFSSEITKNIFQILQTINNRNFEFEVLNFKRRPCFNNTQEVVQRTFKTESNPKINGIEIEALPVNHSVPGANGFLIYTSNAIIGYTGDFKLKEDSFMSQAFLEKLKEVRPDILLCEGTNIDKVKTKTESYVKKNSKDVILNVKGIVFVDFSFKDLTRFETFFKIAKESGRKFVIPFKTAYYLNEIGKIIKEIPSIDDENILIYKEKKRTGTYCENDYSIWEREFLDKQNVVTSEYVKSHQYELIMVLGYYDLPELIDIKPLPGSIYIKSSSEALNEEEEIDLKRLHNWLKHFGVKYYHFHASGHADRKDLTKFINEIKPKEVIPIHTQNPGEFVKILKNNIKLKLPKLSSWRGEKLKWY